MAEVYLSKLLGFPGLLLAAIGAFYMFAGFVLAHHVAFDRALSRAIEMISLEKQARAETLQQAWTIVSAVLIFAGGAALVFLSGIAVWLFAAALLQQVLYLTIAAPRYFDLHDEPDPAGRRQSTNATILYGAVSLGVIAAASGGVFLPLSGEGAFSLVATGMLTAAFATWTFLRLRMPARQGGMLGALESFDEDDDAVQPIKLDEVERLRLAADWYEEPVFVFFFDGDSDFYPARELELSEALANDLDEWQSRFTSVCEFREDAMMPTWADEAQRLAHYARAKELAGRMRDELRNAGYEHIEVSWIREDGEIVILG